MDRQRGHLPGAVETRSPARRIKILSMGDPAAGKSCIIKRFCEGRFIPEYVSTIGIDYGVKSLTIDGAEVKVNFWDVAGDQVYYDVRNEFYKDTNGAILVYDVSSRSTFDNLGKWITELKSLCKDPVTVFLVANKLDAPVRLVTHIEGQTFGDSQGFKYFETSASTGEGVEALFAALFKQILASQK